MIKKIIEVIKKIVMLPIKILKKINEAIKNLILKIFKKKSVKINRPLKN